MSMIRALRTLAALENGTLNAAGLETLLATQARKDELRMLLATRSLFDRIAASKNTCDALAGSATAFSVMTGSVPHRAELIQALLQTSPGKLLIHATDVFLAAMVSSATLMAAARAAGGYLAFDVAANSTTPVSLAGNMPGSAYILLGLGSSGDQASTTINTKRSGSSIANTVSAATYTTNATSNSLAVPLVSPFSFVKATADASAHYFGVLRCDI